jgi:predicted membrane protein
MLVSVLAMRWNVVIGGQELSKTMHGLIYFSPPLLGREGVLAVVTIFALPFGMLWGLTRLFPPWEPNQGQLPAK